jgi:hypothetical protein
LLAAEPPAADSAAVALLRELRDRLDRLETTFADKIRDDAGHEVVVERLHAELQQYKTDLVALDATATTNPTTAALYKAASEVFILDAFPLVVAERCSSASG